MGENLIPQDTRKRIFTFDHVHLEPTEPTAITTDVVSFTLTYGLERILDFGIVVISEAVKINDKKWRNDQATLGQTP